MSQPWNYINRFSKRNSSDDNNEDNNKKNFQLQNAVEAKKKNIRSLSDDPLRKMYSKRSTFKEDKLTHLKTV